MKMVKMRHPNLPLREIEVPETAVPHHQASGWEKIPAVPDNRVDVEPATEAEPPSEPPAEVQQAVAPQSTTPKRRTSKEGN